MEHQAGERQEGRPCHSFGQALVVARQTAEAGQPGETTLDHPAFGQQHEATFRALGAGQRDDRQLGALRRSGLGGFLACVALVHPRQFDRLARHCLHPHRQLRDLGVFLGLQVRAVVVHDDGADWLADVGFGDSFRQPLRMQADVEQDGADGRRYRLRFDAADASWLMQQEGQRQGGESSWEAQYRFTLEPHLMADFADRCHFQQTSPDSHFTQKRICSLALPGGRITLSDRRLITTLYGAPRA